MEQVNEFYQNKKYVCIHPRHIFVIIIVLFHYLLLVLGTCT